MRWLKKFEAHNQYKDLTIGNIKISDRRMFDSLVFNFTWQGKKKLIDYDVSGENFRRCNIDIEACDFLLNSIEENKKLIIETYGVSVYDGIERALGYYFVSIKKKSEGEKVISKKLDNIPTYFSDYDGLGYTLFAHRLEKDGNNLTIFVKNYGGSKEYEINITKNVFKYGDEDIHFWSYYTKRSSKFQDDVRLSENLYNLIKSNTEEVPPFITPKYFKDLGWDVRDESYFKDEEGRLYYLYDNNQVLIVKGDKSIVFDFNNYKAILYDKYLKKIDEKLIKNNQDLKIFN